MRELFVNLNRDVETPLDCGLDGSAVCKPKMKRGCIAQPRHYLQVTPYCAFNAVSSSMNEVCNELSSVPVNFTTTV